MATTPASISGTARGITTTLTGYNIQNESIKTAPVVEQIADQNGAIAEEIIYDTRYDLTFTALSTSSTRTAPATVGSTLSYGGAVWFVDSVESAGTYNGALRFNVAAHRYTNTPSQS